MSHASDRVETRVPGNRVKLLPLSLFLPLYLSHSWNLFSLIYQVLFLVGWRKMQSMHRWRVDYKFQFEGCLAGCNLRQVNYWQVDRQAATYRPFAELILFLPPVAQLPWAGREGHKVKSAPTKAKDDD